MELGLTKKIMGRIQKFPTINLQTTCRGKKTQHKSCGIILVWSSNYTGLEKNYTYLNKNFTFNDIIDIGNAK